MDSLDIWDKDKLALFIAFVIPGFISLKAYELFNPGSHKDSSKLLIDAIAFSCVNYALLFWAIALVEKSQLNITHIFFYILFYLFVLFMAPILWAVLWTKIRRSQFFQNYATHPTLKPWDFLFSQRKPYWIIVTLKNGEKIAGLYGENSFASSEPASEQLYLEEEWLLNRNGMFDRAVNRTAGVLVTAHEIVTVELFKK